MGLDEFIKIHAKEFCRNAQMTTEIEALGEVKAHEFRGFSLKLIRVFTKQMLSSLVLLHAKKVSRSGSGCKYRPFHSQSNLNQSR
jgi:hypothetical protein